MPFASKKLTGAATDTVIVAVPDGYRIRILNLCVNASGLSTATGSVTVRLGLAANHAAPDVLVDQLVAGHIELTAWNYKDHMLASDDGEDLTATTTANADATVSVIYELLKETV